MRTSFSYCMLRFCYGICIYIYIFFFIINNSLDNEHLTKRFTQLIFSVSEVQTFWF